MKKIIKIIIIKISRLLYWLTPQEFKNQHLIALENKIAEHKTVNTFDNFKDIFKRSLIFKDKLSTQEYAIKTSLLNDKNQEYYYLELGVYKGDSSNFFSQFVKKLYSFDGFEGLKEDWIGTPNKKGDMNLNKQVPKLNSNVEITVGWVEDTLDDFLKKHNPKINFVHFDMDTYSPTKFALEKLKPYFVKNAILIFDDYYNYIGWEYGEHKAFKELFDDKEFDYKALNIRGEECVIQIK